jgi:hypothetical protein
MWNKRLNSLGCSLLSLLMAPEVFAHGVAQQDQGFLTATSGVHFAPYMYLGAKHMVTGYDHLLYLAGVIFFLGKLRDIALFVSLFALGHSITLLLGVLTSVHINPFIIDAIIGLSVSYKALENLGAIRFFDPKIMVFTFGLAHGFGLSSKLQDLSLSNDGLVTNMLAFNLGVELGQILALVLLYWCFTWLRRQPHFESHARGVNLLLFAAGLMLFGMQTVGYFLS